MKSYFAKLAARATLANVPAPSPATTANPHDPFVDTSTIIEPSSRTTIAWETPGSDRVGTTLAQVPPTNDTHTSQLEMVKSDVRFEHNALPASPEHELTIEAKSASKTFEKPMAAAQHDREQARSENSISNTTREHVLQPPLAPAGMQTSTHDAKIESTSQPEMNAALVEDDREQSVLLQKADAFMAALLDRRTEETSTRDQNQQITERPQRHEIVREPAPARLQPAPVAARPTESADESPSLVIGKLTVEVLPPPPPPIAPSRQVIVVRGDRNARTHAIRSSQRFGLGQF